MIWQANTSQIYIGKKCLKILSRNKLSFNKKNRQFQYFGEEVLKILKKYKNIEI